MEQIQYRKLLLNDITPFLLKDFNRYQETSFVLFKNQNQYKIKEDNFTDSWNDVKKAEVLKDLQHCINSGGFVLGAFRDNQLIGFANVESKRFGSENQYVELPYIHISNKHRGRGIGKHLFELCCRNAKLLGAKKLYIGAHPSVETQQFYQKVGCTYAEEINEAIYKREPLDIQLEYHLYK
jgi:ribosomal protein S18 acetylase RimI-like enzyme